MKVTIGSYVIEGTPKEIHEYLTMVENERDKPNSTMNFEKLSDTYPDSELPIKSSKIDSSYSGNTFTGRIYE